MLTPREQSIKEALLGEMEGFSYKEIRHIRDRLDPDFLDEGARIVRRQQRRRMWMGILCFLYVVAVTIAMGVKVGRWTPPILLLMGVLWVIVYFQQYGWFQKRLLIYRILQVLADDSHGQAGPAQATEPDTD
jgi:hypothetical protein